MLLIHPFGDDYEVVFMGSNNDKRWFHVLRDRILGNRELSGSTGDDDVGVGEEIRRQSDHAGDGVQDAPPAPQPERPTDQHVNYTPPEGPEVAPPRNLGAMSDGTSMMYVQTCFWVANYVRLRAERGDFTEDQLIEQFGVNVRRCINPEWKGQA